MSQSFSRSGSGWPVVLLPSKTAPNGHAHTQACIISICHLGCSEGSKRIDFLLNVVSGPGGNDRAHIETSISMWVTGGELAAEGRPDLELVFVLNPKWKHSLEAYLQACFHNLANVCFLFKD